MQQRSLTTFVHFDLLNPSVSDNLLTSCANERQQTNTLLIYDLALRGTGHDEQQMQDINHDNSTSNAVDICNV